MTFRFPKSALPPERTAREEEAFRIKAKSQYQEIVESYTRARIKDDKEYRRILKMWREEREEEKRRAYAHAEQTETPPEGEGEGASPPARD